MTTLEILTKLDACGPARDWAVDYPDPQYAWMCCADARWMLWLAARIGVDLKLMVIAACACARRWLPFVPASEHRPRLAIEASEAWTRSEATLEEVRLRAADARRYFALGARSTAAADAADAVARLIYTQHLIHHMDTASIAFASILPGVWKDARTVRLYIPWSIVEQRLAQEGYYDQE